MPNDNLSTEDLIFQAANNIFLLYGYHGTTLHQIAVMAGVNKSAIHYYFRSKEKLYGKVVIFVLENILKADINFTNQKIIEKQRWFLSTELYNNRNLFEQALIEIFPNEWNKKLNYTKKWLKDG